MLAVRNIQDFGTETNRYAFDSLPYNQTYDKSSDSCSEDHDGHWLILLAFWGVQSIFWHLAIAKRLGQGCGLIEPIVDDLNVIFF